jgi:hypothetical protein
MTLRQIASPPLAELALGVPVLLHIEPLGFDVAGTGLLSRATFVDEGRQRDAVWVYRTGSEAWESSVNSVVSAGLEGKRVDVYEVSAAASSATTELIVRYRETDGDPLFPVDRIAIIRSGQLFDTDLLNSVTGETANGSIDRVLVTPDGRFVAIQTQASNLIGGFDQDANGCSDIYLIDRLRAVVSRVSVSNGLEALADAQLEDIRLDGDGALSVAFTTRDVSFSTQDRNELEDVYVWRLPAATSVSPGVPIVTLASAFGGQAQGGTSALLSARGMFFASDSPAYSAQDTNGVTDVWLAASGLAPAAAWPQALSAGGGLLALDVDAAGNRIVLSGRSAALGLGQLVVDQLAVVDLRSGALSVLTTASDGKAADDAVLSAVTNSKGNLVALSTAASNLMAESGEPPGVALYLYGPIQNASIRHVVVHWNSNKPVEGTRVEIDEPEGSPAVAPVASGLTDERGELTLGSLGEQNYRAYAARSVSASDRADAISASDVLAALKMAHGRNPNADPDGWSGSNAAPAPSAFQFIAADIDADGRVTTNDAQHIAQVALSRSVVANPDWRVFGEAAALGPLSRSSVHWPTPVTTADTSSVDEVRWVAVLPGDVDGDWHSSTDYLIGAQWTQSAII